MWGALLSAGASLVGGALNRNAQKKANARQEYLNSPAGIRAESEKAGFNPLVFAGAAGSFGSNGPAPSMGNAIANAAMSVSDGITNEEQLKIQKGQLELDNRRLNAQIEASTLRPQVAGIYGGSSYAGSNNGTAPQGGDTLSSGGDIDDPSWVDLRREVKVKPTESMSGEVIIDNSLTAGRVHVPGSDGDVMGFDELLTLAVTGGPQVARNWLHKGFEAAGLPTDKIYPSDVRDAYTGVVNGAASQVRDVWDGFGSTSTPSSPPPSFYGPDAVRRGFSFAQ